MAYRIQTLADIERDSENYVVSEELYNKAQKMIATIWGEEHPYILQYNGNLITTLNIKMNHQPDISEADQAAIKESMKQIIEKNYEIAKTTFGATSIHFLFYVSMTLTNKVALGEITKPTLANPMIKEMKEIITKFHGGDPRNLANQLFFQQQLIYA